MNQIKFVYKIVYILIFLNMSMLTISRKKVVSISKLNTRQKKISASVNDQHTTSNSKKIVEKSSVCSSKNNGDIIFCYGINGSQAAKQLEKKTKLFRVNFSGYIKPEYFWDSRQNIGYRNDQVLIYPEPKELDRCGYDIQAHPEYGMVAIESRIGAEIIGPDVLGAEAKGYIEADFWGVDEKTVNVFRLRHAYTCLNWKKMSLLFGQYWHPLYVPECSPNTISGNSGVPMDPYKRAPQFRFTRKFRPFEITFAALSEVHFNNDGPIGPSCTYMRNAVIPNLSADVKARSFNNIYGLTVDFKRLVPRLKSDLNVKVEESILSAACAIYATFNWETFVLRIKGTIAQNLTAHGMIGGYGVHSIQPESDKRTYTNLQTLGMWTDFNITTNSIEPGCFIGFAKNIGSSRTIIPAIKKNNEIEHLTYGFNTQTIDYVFRIQPRIRWFFNPIVFGLEIDHTEASYGQPNIYGKVTGRPSNLHPENHPVYPGKTANTRLLFAALYYF